MTRAPMIVAAAAVLTLFLWPVRIDSAFGLPAHPLLVHAPVVLVPILCLAALAVAATDRHVLPVAAFSVAALAATMLAAGSGEAFKRAREDELTPDKLDTLQQHAEAGDFLRWLVILLTVGLIAATATLPKPARVTTRVLIALLAATTLIWVIRTGHLGSKTVWG